LKYILTNPRTTRSFERGQWADRDGSAGQPRVSSRGHPDKHPPEVPKSDRRQGTDPRRSRLQREFAKFGGPIGTIIEVSSWAYKYSPLVAAYNDAPKSLDELQNAASTPNFGYDIHHVVEKTCCA
jgi:hypothetical protein